MKRNVKKFAKRAITFAGKILFLLSALCLLLALSRAGYYLPLPVVQKDDPGFTGEFSLKYDEFTSRLNGTDYAERSFFSLGIKPYITGLMVFMFLLMLPKVANYCQNMAGNQEQSKEQQQEEFRWLIYCGVFLVMLTHHSFACFTAWQTPIWSENGLITSWLMLLGALTLVLIVHGINRTGLIGGITAVIILQYAWKGRELCSVVMSSDTSLYVLVPMYLILTGIIVEVYRHFQLNLRGYVSLSDGSRGKDFSHPIPMRNLGIMPVIMGGIIVSHLPLWQNPVVYSGLTRLGIPQPITCASAILLALGTSLFWGFITWGRETKKNSGVQRELNFSVKTLLLWSMLLLPTDPATTLGGIVQTSRFILFLLISTFIWQQNTLPVAAAQKALPTDGVLVDNQNKPVGDQAAYINSKLILYTLIWAGVLSFLVLTPQVVSWFLPLTPAQKIVVQQYGGTTVLLVAGGFLEVGKNLFRIWKETGKKEEK
jgi:preprotein translocase subunit SecY